GDIHRDVVHHLLPLGLDRDRIYPVAAFRGGPGVVDEVCLHEGHVPARVEIVVEVLQFEFGEPGGGGIVGRATLGLGEEVVAASRVDVLGPTGDPDLLVVPGRIKNRGALVDLTVVDRPPLGMIDGERLGPKGRQVVVVRWVTTLVHLLLPIPGGIGPVGDGVGVGPLPHRGVGDLTLVLGGSTKYRNGHTGQEQHGQRTRTDPEHGLHGGATAPTHVRVSPTVHRMGGVGVLGVGIVVMTVLAVLTVRAVLGVGGRRSLGGVVVLRPAVGCGRVSPRV